MSDTPPRRKKKNFNCSVCSFKAKGPSALAEHYREEPTHRRVAKQNWQPWHERKKREEQKRTREIVGDVEGHAGEVASTNGAVGADNPFPQVSVTKVGRRTRTGLNKPINFCPECGHDLRGFTQ